MPHYNLPHNHGQNIEKVLDKIPPAERFRDIAFLFQQLDDPTRLRINMWAAVFADVGVSVIAILNAIRAMRVKVSTVSE